MAKKNVITPGGTRTRNPQIRSLMRYPLRHWGIKILARADVPSPWVHCSSAPFHFFGSGGPKTVNGAKRVSNRHEAMAQRQRVGFQTQRLGVRIPLASHFSFSR